MSKNWVNFKVLCGWSGCGHPACVRLKVAEIAGLEVGREGSGEQRVQARGSRGTECKGLNLAVWHVGTTGVGQTVEVASRSHSAEAHKGIGISGPWLWGLDTKGTWSTADALGDCKFAS